MNDKALSVIRVNVAVVGDAGVGKSSLVLRFTKNDFPFPDYAQNILGVNFLRRSLDFKDKTVVFNILGTDSAGPYRYRSLLSSYLRDADCAMFLYDISSRKSFEDAEGWLLDLKQYGHTDLKCALIGNKVDLDDSLRQVPTHEGKLLADGHGVYFGETSAKSGEGTEKVLYDIGSELVERCKKEKISSTVSLSDSYVHRMRKTCC